MSKGCYIVHYIEKPSVGLTVFQVGEEVAMLDVIKGELLELSQASKKVAGQIIDQGLDALKVNASWGSKLPYAELDGLAGKGRVLIYKGENGK